MESRLLSVEARVRQQAPRTQPVQTYTLPYWDVIALGDTATITSTTFPEFDDTSRTDRVPFRLATAGGELFLHDWDDKVPMRATISIDAKVNCSIPIQVAADGAGDWWIEVNGAVTAYTASQYISVALRQGPNTIRIFKDFNNTNRYFLKGLLFDGDTTTWVPPT